MKKKRDKEKHCVEELEEKREKKKRCIGIHGFFKNEKKRKKIG